MSSDPALLRNAHLHERAIARYDIAASAAMFGAGITFALVGMFTNDTMLIIGTFAAPVLIFFSVKRFAGGLGRHAHASLKLHQLHARDTGLPTARVVDK